MIKDSNKKLFDMVIIWKLDRLARNRHDSARYKSTLKKNCVKAVSAAEVISDGGTLLIGYVIDDERRFQINPIDCTFCT